MHDKAAEALDFAMEPFSDGEEENA